MHRSEPVKLIVEDIESLKKGINYLVPIRLQSQSKTYPALPGSDVLYVVLNRTILMNVPKLNGENYFKVNFKDQRSEEHTSELQSRQYLVCRLLLEKKTR